MKTFNASNQESVVPVDSHVSSLEKTLEGLVKAEQEKKEEYDTAAAAVMRVKLSIQALRGELVEREGATRTRRREGRRATSGLTTAKALEIAATVLRQDSRNFETLESEVRKRARRENLTVSGRGFRGLKEALEEDSRFECLLDGRWSLRKVPSNLTTTSTTQTTRSNTNGN